MAENKKINLTQKFIKGLKKYGLTQEDINNKWKYCGGNSREHLNYYKITHKGMETPYYSDRCICGHHIKENCYLTDGNEILILGNCCIKKFVEKNTRTCEKCGEPHKNRRDNLCNTCRLALVHRCAECGKKCEEIYKFCYACFRKHRYYYL